MALPQIIGPGTFKIEVVGESYYQDHLEAICGGRKKTSASKEVRAVLLYEDANQFDNKAVAILVDGVTVGYLAKKIAREFRGAAIAGGLADCTSFECDAVIRGGWDRGDGRPGSFGIWLDLPQDDDYKGDDVFRIL